MHKQVELLLKLEEIERKKLGREAKRALVDALEAEIGEALVRYYRMRQLRSGSGLAMIHNGICLGCGMHYPEANRVIQKLETEVVRCEFCGRIVYPSPPGYSVPEKPKKEEPAAKPAPPVPPAATVVPAERAESAPAAPPPSPSRRSSGAKKKPARPQRGARKRPAARKVTGARSKSPAKKKAGRRAAPARKRARRAERKSPAAKPAGKARSSRKKAARRK